MENKQHKFTKSYDIDFDKIKNKLENALFRHLKQSKFIKPYEINFNKIKETIELNFLRRRAIHAPNFIKYLSSNTKSHNINKIYVFIKVCGKDNITTDNKSPLWYYVANKITHDDKIVKLLMSKKLLELQADDKYNPLMIYCINNDDLDYYILKLLANDVSINQQYMGVTALSYILKNYKNKQFGSCTNPIPLNMYKNDDIINTLISADNINYVDINGISPLSYYVNNPNNTDLIYALSTRKILNKRDKYGRVPLHYFLKSFEKNRNINDVLLVKKLITYENIYYIDNNGQTAYDMFLSMCGFYEFSISYSKINEIKYLLNPDFNKFYEQCTNFTQNNENVRIII